MNQAVDVKPSNSKAVDIKPSNLGVSTPNFTYLETRTINKGQPLPWGINWAITYPATLVFIAQRL